MAKWRIYFGASTNVSIFRYRLVILDDHFWEKLIIEKKHYIKTKLNRKEKMLHKISSKKGSRSDPAPEVHVWNESAYENVPKKREDKRTKAFAKLR